MRRPPRLLGLLVAVGLAGCRTDTVTVTFRPPGGAHYRYEVRVESEAVTTLGGEPRRAGESAVLTVEHRVLDAGPGGVRVEVRLSRPNSASRTLVVRLDRAASLQAVESIEGVPATALGDLGLTEVFPAAAGAPPDRPLRPGEDWVIDEPVRLPGATPSRLVGIGRLTELGVVGDRRLASVWSRTRLVVDRRTPLATGILAIEGSQLTESTARHDLEDGAVHEATSRTQGRFRLVLSPPPGLAAPPVVGSLSLDVRSTVRRLR